jgi:hypothetical protein
MLFRCDFLLDLVRPLGFPSPGSQVAGHLRYLLTTSLGFFFWRGSRPAAVILVSATLTTLRGNVCSGKRLASVTAVLDTSSRSVLEALQPVRSSSLIFVPRR